MPEDPIKLFSKRSERYPEADEADTIQGGARAALAVIPVIGGTITEVLSIVLAPAVSRRRDEWFKELANGLDRLEETVEGFRVEDLVSNDAFVSAAIQATRVATATHQKEKRECLRNALLNLALGKTPGEELQHVFINAIDAFTASHVKVLNVLRNAAGFLTEHGLWNCRESARDQYLTVRRSRLCTPSWLDRTIFCGTSWPTCTIGTSPLSANRTIHFLRAARMRSRIWESSS
jgi:hypothetical protein